MRIFAPGCGSGGTQGDQDAARTEAVLDRIAGIDEMLFKSNPWGRKSFADSVQNEFDLLLAAEEEETGEILGYGLLRSFDDAELIRIAVVPEARRRGIAGRMLSVMTDHAGKCGASGIFLEVRSSNTPAIGLYRSAGFKEEGVRKGYYHDPKEDALIMRYSC